MGGFDALTWGKKKEFPPEILEGIQREVLLLLKLDESEASVSIMQMNCFHEECDGVETVILVHRSKGERIKFRLSGGVGEVTSERLRTTIMPMSFPSKEG